MFRLVLFGSCRRSSSDPAFAGPPSPRGRFFCRKNDTEQRKAVTTTTSLAHALSAGIARSPRGKVFCRKNETEQGKAVTNTDALAHALSAATGRLYMDFTFL